LSQTKYKLPDDLKMQCISIVRGYDRRKDEYHKKREAIIYGSTKPSDGQPKGNMTGNPTYDKVIKLEMIENDIDTKLMRSVEQSRIQIGVDIISETERQRLTDAIWDSCIYGRNFIFEYQPLSMGKTCFYKHRRKFLFDIAKNIGYI